MKNKEERRDNFWKLFVLSLVISIFVFCGYFWDRTLSFAENAQPPSDIETTRKLLMLQTQVENYVAHPDFQVAFEKQYPPHVALVQALNSSEIDLTKKSSLGSRNYSARRD